MSSLLVDLSGSLDCCCFFLLILYRLFSVLLVIYVDKDSRLAEGKAIEALKQINQIDDKLHTKDFTNDHLQVQISSSYQTYTG